MSKKIDLLNPKIYIPNFLKIRTKEDLKTFVNIPYFHYSTWLSSLSFIFIFYSIYISLNSKNNIS